MILQRLYELAQRANLLSDPAFVPGSVACRVDIDADGRFLGLHDLRQRRELPPRGKRGKPRVVLTKGKSLSIPVRPVVWDDEEKSWKTTNATASGKEKPAVFLADTIARVLSVDRLIDPKHREKNQAQRSTFWRFVDHAAEITGNARLKAVVAFGKRMKGSPELCEEIAKEVATKKLRVGDICTFACNEDEGVTVLEHEPVREWWRQVYKQDFSAQLEGQYHGLCQVTGQVTAIQPSVKSKIKGLTRIGGGAEAYLVTGLEAADSYNFPGAVASMVSAQGIDALTRAVNALIDNQLPAGHDPTVKGGVISSHQVGGVLFLFWTREPADTQFVMALGNPEPEQVEALFRAAHSAKKETLTSDPNQFYLLGLTGKKARAAVRDYLEAPLPRVWDNLAKWFRDITIADTTKDGQGQPSYRFPLASLAAGTGRWSKDNKIDWESVPPDAQTRLMHAAFTGGPVPESLLVACLRRLRVEGSAGFRPTRMALIKLILTRREVSVSETLSADERHPAYVYGRLLAVFERIQYAAQGDVNANVVDRFYGRFSTAPYLVLRRLIDGALEHLKKLRGEKPGFSVTLDRLLTEVLALAPAAPLKRQLTLEEQARFSLGYYHQKAKQMEERAERRQQAAAKAAQT